MSSIKMTLRRRILGLGFLGITAAAAVGITGLVAVSQMKAGARELAANTVIQRAQMSADQAHDAVRSEVLAGLVAAQHGDTRTAAAALDRVQAEAKTLREALRTTGTVADTAVTTRLEHTMPIVERYVGLAQSEAKLAMSDPRAATAELSAFTAVFDSLVTGIDDLGNAVAAHSRVVEADANRVGGAARTWILSALLLALAIGIALSLYIAAVILRPVREMARVASALAQGDVDQRVEADSDDEVGQLARAFSAMIDAERRLASTAAALASGDVSDAMQPRSDRDVVVQAFARLRATLLALVGETSRLTAAANAGRLAERGEAQKFEGSYRELVAGINATMEAVVAPINEAATTLDRLSKRDLTARMEGNYSGDFAKIKDAINLAGENLEEALAEVAVASEQVAAASDQINTGSQALAQGSSEQASALEEVSSSLQEMASMAKQSASNAKEARGLAEAAREGTAKGVESMQRLTTAMGRIKESSDATAKIVKTIDEIAFQTNLLALNAAVEAARAGDAGKGFAVVAEEVRNLAMRSAEAAKNTANLIEGAVKNAEGGVVITGEVVENLDEITTGVTRVSEVMNEIAAASDQQTQGITQVNTAVDQMNGVTQQTAANSEESASAAEELSSQAARMREMVETFRLNSTSARAEARDRGTPRAGRPTATHTARATPAGRLGSPRLPSFASRDVLPLHDDGDDETLEQF
ncbi:MAG TPA: methyl-accepting chemotaxis protein [Gemmatimonadaceae bacterium]